MLKTQARCDRALLPYTRPWSKPFNSVSWLTTQEFKAFVEILAPQSEVPTMLELHVLMARDMLCCGKPSRSTFNKYIACMM